MIDDDKLREKVEKYLVELFETDIKVTSIEIIGKKDDEKLKTFGYGKPYRIHYIRNSRNESIVLESMSENSFGHDHFSDRAQILLWHHSASSKLPKHVRSLDVGAFTNDDQIISLGKAEEFFVISEFISGKEYAFDLQRILASESFHHQDKARAITLAEYLAEIHSTKTNAPQLYRRRIRELLGHGECIMGLIDNYPDHDPLATPELLQRIEEGCLKWRWRLRGYENRLCQVHGDFHPWNILFREDSNFTVLDRSRGEFGDPADDVTSMLINYLFLSLQKYDKLTGPFETLYRIFWETYLDSTSDTQMRFVMQPFFVWRALVLANPVWYPNITRTVRQRLFRFMQNVLQSNDIEVFEINKYLE
jgi:hypothetical protein